MCVLEWTKSITNKWCTAAAGKSFCLVLMFFFEFLVKLPGQIEYFYYALTAIEPAK